MVLLFREVSVKAAESAKGRQDLLTVHKVHEQKKLRTSYIIVLFYIMLLLVFNI